MSLLASGVVFSTFLFCLGKLVRETYNSALSMNAGVGSDYNPEGIRDLVVENNGGLKTILYGVEDDEGVVYLSSKEMKRRNPESIIDYESVERRLNEESN